MTNDPRQQIIEFVESCDERQLDGIYKTALSLHLETLQKKQKDLEKQIADTKRHLAALSGKPAKPKRKRVKKVAKKPAAVKARKRRRSGPRVSDLIRQTLRTAGGPMSLDAISKAVAAASGRPMNDNFRSYIAQLMRREQSIKRLSRGQYAISI